MEWDASWDSISYGEIRGRGGAIAPPGSGKWKIRKFAIWGEMTPNYSAVLDFGYQLRRHGLLPSNNYSQSPTKQLRDDDYFQDIIKYIINILKYGMCMDKNLYIIHMKYVMYNRTEGNKY